jgi:hypothetical protein
MFISVTRKKRQQQEYMNLLIPHKFNKNDRNFIEMHHGIPQMEKYWSHAATPPLNKVTLVK